MYGPSVGIAPDAVRCDSFWGRRGRTEAPVFGSRGAFDAWDESPSGFAAGRLGAPAGSGVFRRAEDRSSASSGEVPHGGRSERCSAPYLAGSSWGRGGSAWDESAGKRASAGEAGGALNSKGSGPGGRRAGPPLQTRCSGSPKFLNAHVLTAVADKTATAPIVFQETDMAVFPGQFGGAFPPATEGAGLSHSRASHFPGATPTGFSPRPQGL